VTVISSDRVRRILVAQPAYTDQEHAFIHAVCLRLARRGLDEGCTVALDSTNLRQQHRQRFLDLACRYHAPCHFVLLECEEATIRSRLRRRTRGEGTDGSTADERVYELLRETVEPVREPHVRVRGDGDVTRAARTVLNLLPPEGVALPAYQPPAWARPTIAAL
jgi:predicted kinase